MRAADIPLPKEMRTLERDPRGFPIPFIVVHDTRNEPHFPVNDQLRVAKCMRARLCAVCGKKLTDGYWFVGGIRCFTHPLGAFIDPPAHEACARYALQVCPYLAAPKYLHRLDTAKLTERAALPDLTVIIKNEGVSDGRPDLFALGRTTDYVRVPGGNPWELLMRAENWTHVETWKQGNMVEVLPLPIVRRF